METTEKRNPIQILTDALSEITVRAMVAEREIERMRAEDTRWYELWKKKDAELKETAAKLAAEIEDHQFTHDKLKRATGYIAELEGQQADARKEDE